jgi:hypothetical protein
MYCSLSWDQLCYRSFNVRPFIVRHFRIFVLCRSGAEQLQIKI